MAVFQAIVLENNQLNLKLPRRVWRKIFYILKIRKRDNNSAYYDMDFAFGEVTPKKFIYNYVAQWKDLRSSSMCACFGR